MPENASSVREWPDLKIAFTSISAVVFLASLLFVSGFSIAVGHNLLSLFELTDYLRIAPGWALLTLAGSIVGLLFRLGLERPATGLISHSEQHRNPAPKLPRWLPRWFPFALFSVSGIAASVLQAWHSDLVFTIVAWLYCPIAILLLSLWLRPGWAHVFQLPPLFANFIPLTAWVLGVAFWTGLYFLVLVVPFLPIRVITMKDHSKYEGRVVLELNRYVLFENAGQKLTALQSSEIQMMDFLNRSPSAP
jgi:hypothetical protein